jgi:uncharacterized protein YcnI
MTFTRRAAVATLVATGAFVLSALPAWAHVEPDPARVRPGKKVTVEFTPADACDGSVTTQMRFRVPAGVTGAKPVQQPGWSATVAGRTITFASDKVPDAETSFGITFTAPKSKTLLSWKVVQGCQDGLVRWIQGPKGEHPAPVVGVGKTPPEVD